MEAAFHTADAMGKRSENRLRLLLPSSFDVVDYAPMRRAIDRHRELYPGAGIDENLYAFIDIQDRLGRTGEGVPFFRHREESGEGDRQDTGDKPPARL